MRINDRMKRAFTSAQNTARQAPRAAAEAAQKARDLRASANAVLDPAAAEARRAAEAALQSRPARAAKDVFDATRPLRENMAAEASPSLVKGWVTSDSTWGKSYSADTGERRPQRFGYGEKWATLLGGETPRLPNQPEWVELAGARGRFMGNANSRELSVGFGSEVEAGLLLSREVLGVKNEAFIGLRTRSTVEAGMLGQSIGSELFLGAEANSRFRSGRGTDAPLLNVAVQGRGGLHVAQQVSNDLLGVSFQHSAEIGVRVRALAELTFPLLRTQAGDIGVMTRIQGWAFAGAMERLDASAGLKGVGLEVAAYVGAKVGGSYGHSFTLNNAELLGLAMRGEVWAGLGFRLHGRLGLDAETKTLGLKLDVGAALGIGGSAGVDVVVAGAPGELIGATTLAK